MPNISGFILGLENQAGQQTGHHSYGNAAGSGFQAAGENSKKSICVHGFFDALGKIVSEAGQGNGGPCSREFHNGLVHPDSAQKYADDKRKEFTSLFE